MQQLAIFGKTDHVLRVTLLIQPVPNITTSSQHLKELIELCGSSPYLHVPLLFLSNIFSGLSTFIYSSGNNTNIYTDSKVLKFIYVVQLQNNICSLV